MRTNWFEDFFHGLALEFWRNAVTPEEAQRDVDFIEAELGLSKASRILDIACGNGRHSVELAKRGYEMTSVDLSDEFIADARRSANANRVRLDAIAMDMRALRFDEKFSGAFCFGNSFGYMHHAANVEFLERVSQYLKPGAKLVIETGLTAESVLPGLQAHRWHRMGDILALSENRFDPSESELHTDYTFIRAGTSESGTATYTIYTVAELKRLLGMCGLWVTGLYGSRERDQYHLGDRLFLTKKIAAD